ncbi:hypothetical protein PC121_g20755 [Phytophthora cactorum]|nr:hypothetical protein PC120_g24412 [Phytophthora cactorum]KAG3046317.1 hypothetical protein PC121_g20755 [Phytophthora cactorum]
MTLYLLKNASTSSNNQDAALLCMLWYLFGRASDFSLVQKQYLTIDAADILFVRFIRLNTSEEQGLTLFTDLDFVTCPVHAVAHHTGRSMRRPAGQLACNAALGAAAAAATTDAAPAEKTLTIYSHVNRVLDRIAANVGVEAALSSHSFRRGGAQHVNGCDGLMHRWIFDHGAWNMSTTHKGFNYIFKTSREGYKVSKALSGYDTETMVLLKDLKAFDAQTQEKITAVQQYLFAT